MKEGNTAVNKKGASMEILSRFFYQYRKDRPLTVASKVFNFYGRLFIKTPLNEAFPQETAHVVEEYYHTRGDRNSTRSMSMSNNKTMQSGVKASILRREESRAVSRAMFFNASVLCIALVIATGVVVKIGRYNLMTPAERSVAQERAVPKSTGQANEHADQSDPRVAEKNQRLQALSAQQFGMSYEDYKAAKQQIENDYK